MRHFASRVAIFVAVLAVLDTPVLSQREGAEVRVGTASIRGRIMSSATGTPLRGAFVSASYISQQGRREAGASTTTDENGAFEFQRLAAGRWRVSAAKAGYVEWEFGQRNALASPAPITLAEGQAFVADVRVPRAGAISGHVLDQFGDPLAGANVSAMRIQMTPHGPRFQWMGTSVLSDDTGAYRVYDLPPGEYYVSVGSGEYSKVIGAAGDNSPPIQRVIFRADAPSSYAPTYYPGTTRLAEAQRLTLGLGEERSGIALRILPARTVRVTGRVMSANGVPLRATVSLVGALGQTFTSSGGFIGNGSGSVSTMAAARVPAAQPQNAPSNDGGFTLTNVPPGNYTLIALGPGAGDAPPEVASMPLVVSGTDIAGLTIVTGAGGSIHGTVIAENNVRRLPEARIGVTALPVQVNQATWAPRTKVDESGAFALGGMLGIYTLRFESLPAGWIVKSVTANGSDVSDAAIDVRAGDRVSVLVELTDRVTQVSGTVRLQRDVRDGIVVVFADEPAKWTSSSRFVKTAPIAGDGRFAISGLPPHQRYLAVAVDYLEESEAWSPEFLQRAKAVASASFGLLAGGQQTLDLPIVVR